MTLWRLLIFSWPSNFFLPYLTPNSNCVPYLALLSVLTVHGVNLGLKRPFCPLKCAALGLVTRALPNFSITSLSLSLLSNPRIDRVLAIPLPMHGHAPSPRDGRRRRHGPAACLHPPARHGLDLRLGSATCTGQVVVPWHLWSAC